MWKLHFSMKKVESFRTRLPLTYKENSFPNVNFKLIFKLDKASLGANQRSFNVAEMFLEESYFLPSHEGPLKTTAWEATRR